MEEVSEAEVPKKQIPADYADEEDVPEVRLRSGIDLNDLRAGKETIFELDCDEGEDFHKTAAREYFNPEEIFSGTDGHMPVFDSDEDEEEDKDDERTPFDKLASKMSSVTEDGGVKKRIRKQGVGGNLREGNVVKIHYQAYAEYADEPFDSTVMRSQPMKVLLGKGLVIPGLDIALLSMKKKEQAQFLIQHEYAYGEQGCEPRIPKKATLLYNIEVLEAAESAGADEYFLMDRAERKELDLKTMLKYVRDEITKGKEFFKTDQLGKAVGRYKTCLRILDERGPKNEEEEKAVQKEQIRVNNNLAVVCLKQNSLGQVIYHAHNTLAIEPKNAKALYLKGKALMKKGEFDRAKVFLGKAQSLAPGDKSVSQALKDLDKEIKKWKLCEQNMYRKMFTSEPSEENDSGDASQSAEDKENTVSKAEKQKIIKEAVDTAAVSAEFKESIRGSLSYFVENKELMEMPYPTKGFTVREMAVVLEVVEEMGLHYKSVGEGSNAHVYLMKTKPS